VCQNCSPETFIRATKQPLRIQRATILPAALKGNDVSVITSSVHETPPVAQLDEDDEEVGRKVFGHKIYAGSKKATTKTF
jgi:hypothetical protein